MLADNEPMKFYERTISPTLLFRIKDTSKTLVNVFDASLIRNWYVFNSRIHRMYISYSLVFPYSLETIHVQTKSKSTAG